MWQKNGKGLKFKGHYLKDQSGERVIVLSAIDSKGQIKNVTAESWQMLVKAGWSKL